MTKLIRNATAEDAPILCQAEQYWAGLTGYLVSNPSELKVDSFARRIQELTTDPKGLYVVAESVDGKIVGHALLDPIGLQSLSHIVRLTIVIHPGSEGKGVGSILMEKIVTWARQANGVEKIELLVRAQNSRAIHLYKKFGFVEEGRLRNRIKLNEGKYIDDLAMGLMIK